MQLYPDLMLEQEDTKCFSTSCTINPLEKSTKWMWLVMGRTIYLCTPPEDELDPASRQILHHSNVVELLRHYVTHSS